MCYSFKLNSHPEVLLKEHLEHVAEEARVKIRTKNLRFSIDKDILEEVAFLMGLSHDIGKATSYFQEYIHSIERGKVPCIDKEKKSHGLLSALFGYILVENYLEKQVQKSDLLDYLPSLAFTAIKRHHGNLEDIFKEFDYSNQRLKSERKLIEDQLEEIDYEELEEILKPYIVSSIDNIHASVFALLDRLPDEEEKFDDYHEEETYELFILSKLLFSTLISSDKYDAIFHQRENTIEHQIETDLVDRYKILKNFNKDHPVNKIREEVYEDVLGSLKGIEKNDRIMSITLPTGTGKTLTSFSFALNLKNRLENENKREYKIIYSLPFTSIIDQNFNVFEEIFKNIKGNIPTNEVLLKHHYLADLSYTGGNDEFNINESKFMIENWKSQIIVTTFIQFFHTIFSNRNAPLMKYHNIANSIVILDEIQSIHHKYWEIINGVFKAMAKYLDIYFILVTATQPLIFDKSKGEIKELAQRSKHYFEMFNRTKLHLNIEEALHIENFLEWVEDLIGQNSQNDILVVMNTIKSSLQVYEFIELLSLENTELYYLSTNIIPRDRKERIKDIKKNSKPRKIIVSTQLIEAGVDIDVNLVIRDFGPLDSINQVAGRCNRNGKKQQGDVYIFRLKNDKKEYNQYVYDDILIAKTIQVLKEYSMIEEKKFLNIADAYFKIVKAHKSKERSRKLLESIYRIEHEKVKDDFKLIEQDYEKVDVFIEIDEHARKIWNKYEQIGLIANRIERRNRFLEIKKEFHEYVISINKNKFLKDIEGLYGYISYEEKNGVYDEKTGYKNIDETIIF
jgi:CRISPR-associated endonuclease/helicase Cas3